MLLDFDVIDFYNVQYQYFDLNKKVKLKCILYYPQCNTNKWYKKSSASDNMSKTMKTYA